MIVSQYGTLKIIFIYFHCYGLNKSLNKVLLCIHDFLWFVKCFNRHSPVNDYLYYCSLNKNEIQSISELCSCMCNCFHSFGFCNLTLNIYICYHGLDPASGSRKVEPPVTSYSPVSIGKNSSPYPVPGYSGWW